MSKLINNRKYKRILLKEVIKELHGDKGVKSLCDIRHW